MADAEPLFIVDNSEGGRTGLDYLREWTEIASTFDVATGFFDIGALLALDGHWQKLKSMRILMGDEVGAPTKRALLAAITARATRALDDSIEKQKTQDPFLEGADSVVAALTDGRITCRVFNRDKFHAKTYITHGRLEAVGSQALLGSSNFTRAGLTQNVELNIRIQDDLQVEQLQRWYEKHWKLGEEVTPAILQTIERHTAEYSPFDVYAAALRALVADRDPGDLGWDQQSSKVYSKLDRYQQEAYSALLAIADQHGGALLCDGVGLGKTFVGLMLIERLIMREGKRVLLLAPKAVSEGVWEKELNTHLAHVGGSKGTADFSALTLLNHTDLTRGDPYPERFARMAELADAIVIDEAHHFRNRGPQPLDDDPSSWSRYHHLRRIIEGSERQKQLYLLTATPINNSLNDFRHLIELFSQGNDGHFSQTLGVPSVAGSLNRLTKRVREDLGPDSVIDSPDALQEVLSEEPLFQGLVVQRSRSYARKSQILEKGEATAFPDRGDPEVVPYSLEEGHGRLLELIDESFKREKPLFSLAMYNPLAFYVGDDESVKTGTEENRQQQVVGLIRTNFLKRFESSVFAFETSCDRLMRRLLAFMKVNSTTEAEKKLAERWIHQHDELLGFVTHRQLELLGEEIEEEDQDSEDVVPLELVEKLDPLDPAQFDLSGILAECLLDLDQISKLLEVTRRFVAKDDDKLRALIKLLKKEAKGGRKVLVFTEFADTARYLKRQLMEAGISGVEELDGSRGVDRGAVITRFAPYYNGSSKADLQETGAEEIEVLVATDVLSEGLNLQDATRVVNYDIHWNPVRLMQRIGRVDRRLNPEVEARLVADKPEVAGDRGKVLIRNFLPPNELDTLLKLYETVSFKTLLISKTLGIEGKKFLGPDDEFDALKEFNSAYEGSTSTLEELHLEYQELIAGDDALEVSLAELPSSIFSGRISGREGVFLCFQLPALDTETETFALEAGVTRWYLHTADGVVEKLDEIAEAIRSDPETKRLVRTAKPSLLAARAEVEKHIKNTHLKALNAPLDAPTPRLVCWMELTLD